MVVVGSGRLKSKEKELKEYTDRELLSLYSQYSEEAWAAGFMQPSESEVRSFKRWLLSWEATNREERPLEDYELEFLRIYKELA